jgi:hypothetical protein
LARLAPPPAFTLALAQRDVRAGEIGYVAVGHEEVEAPGKLNVCLRKGLSVSKNEAMNTVSYSARGKPCQALKVSRVFDELLVAAEVRERRIEQPEPRLGLSRPKQGPGLKEIPRLLGNRECSLEVDERLGELPKQKMPLAEEISTERGVDLDHPAPSV